MSNHIDFYFDIISPYAFIAYKNIIKIEHTKVIFGMQYNVGELQQFTTVAGMKLHVFQKTILFLKFCEHGQRHFFFFLLIVITKLHLHSKL